MLTKHLFWIFAAILPFSFALNPTQGIDLSLVRVFVPALFLAWLASSLARKELLVDKRVRFWLLITIIFVSTLSCFWAIDEFRAFRKILFLLSLVPIYLVSFSVTQTENDRRVLFKIFTWSSLIVSLFALAIFFLQFVLGINFALSFASSFVAPLFLGNTFADIVAAFPSWMVNLGGKTVLRTFGTFPDPHLFSLYINMVLPLALYVFIKTKKKIYLAIASVLLLASLLAFSRAAYLSLIFAILFLFLTSNPLRLIKKNVVLVIIVSTLLFYFLALPNPLIQRLESSFDTQEGSNQGRIEMWQAGWETMTNHPATGVGIGNFSRHIEPTSEPRDPIYAHNLLLDFGAETGLFSAIIWLCLILSPLFAFFKKPTLLKKFIAASFVIFLIHSFFETPVYSVRVLPLFLILLSINTNANLIKSQR